jgi:hypothetical protein
LFDYPAAAIATGPVPLWIGFEGCPLRQLAGANNNWTIQVSVNAVGTKVNTFFTKEFGV